MDIVLRMISKMMVECKVKTRYLRGAMSELRQCCLSERMASVSLTRIVMRIQMSRLYFWINGRMSFRSMSEELGVVEEPVEQSVINVY